MIYELSIENHLKTQLLELKTELEKEMVWYALTKAETFTLLEFLELFANKVKEQERKEKLKTENKEIRCQTCRHTLEFHGQLGDRICCKEACQCMKFEGEKNDIIN